MSSALVVRAGIAVLRRLGVYRHSETAEEEGAITGRLHDKSLRKQHLLQVGVIPAGSEAFVLHADLERLIVLQQAQRRTPKDAEVRVGMSATEARLIFAERYVELPKRLFSIDQWPRTAAANCLAESFLLMM